ncbi:MAG TPA: hypothetical protein VH763_03775 [Gemmatimonadales bacterium]|jgi:hypothetical protein
MEAIRTTASHNGEAHDLDALLLFGGAACILFGAGLILSSSMTRRYLGNIDAGRLLQTAVPDVQRYFKLRAM